MYVLGISKHTSSVCSQAAKASSLVSQKLIVLYSLFSMSHKKVTFLNPFKA